MYDCIIVGTGAAGVECALTLKALRRNFLWLGKKELSDKITSAEKIANYAGLPRVSGKQMQEAFLRQIEGEGIEITPLTCTGVYAMGEYFIADTPSGTFEGKTVVLATGIESVKPIEGEKEFLGRGVSYCAVCDGALYRDKTVAVVCSNVELDHDIAFLAKYAKKVYLVPLCKGLRTEGENIEVVSGVPLSLTGERRVEKLLFADKELPVDGVFFLKKAVPPSSLVGGLKTEGEYIVADRKGQTNLKGLFAAGDCTGRPYQYAKAVGEGNVCAHSVNEYLWKKEKK